VTPGRYNINVVNGTTFTLAPIWNINNLAVNLTGYSADMQVRDVSNNLIVELSTANGKAVVSPGLGQVTFTLTATQTSVANLPAGNYTYAINYTDSASNVYQILTGAFVVTTSAVQ
jgi:flagellar hook assembly protein FlgD